MKVSKIKKTRMRKFRANPSQFRQSNKWKDKAPGKDELPELVYDLEKETPDGQADTGNNSTIRKD